MKKHGAGGGHYGGTGRTDAQSSSAGGDVKEKVASAASEVRDRGEDLLEEGREKVEELGQAAGEMARNRADQQLERVVDGIRIFADVLRQGGDDLSGDRRQYRSVLNTVADRAEGVSRYLQERDVQSVTRDVRRFARDNTPLFLGGAFALGLLGARFLKSSSDEGREFDEWQYGEGMQQRYDRMLPENATRMPGGPGYGAGSTGYSAGSAGYGAGSRGYGAGSTGQNESSAGGSRAGFGPGSTGSTTGTGAMSGTGSTTPGSTPGSTGTGSTAGSTGTGSTTGSGPTTGAGATNRTGSEPGSRGRS
jgi:hypothetical protein